MKKILLIILIVVILLAVIFFAVGYFANPEFKGEKTVKLKASDTDIFAWLSDIEDLPNRRSEITGIEMQENNEAGQPAWKELTDMGGFALFERLEFEENHKLTVRMKESTFGMSGTWSYTIECKEDVCAVNIMEDSRIDSLPIRAILTLAGRDANLKAEVRYLSDKFEVVE